MREMRFLFKPMFESSSGFSQVYSNFSIHALNQRKMAMEVEKALAATPGGDTIFGKILRKEMPCNFIYEDDQNIERIKMASYKYECFNNISPENLVIKGNVVKEKTSQEDVSVHEDEFDKTLYEDVVCLDEYEEDGN
ncbi:histidine triad nucleotide-binding protein 1 isoform X3 [Belonocnema kinseyi]|uniref:histidine triad nucleotide-binding protein 1 isoform X3 n=1 Tax=Belonocnema kinseyi TaxID=2817044 RepID=UPI00143D4D63|nr:histidine triad nucleotide-binding protein 1 isoform X3 [Belonocnema kinseyi]XP_033218621.1 histidine triad nucleotide-binding protein 1 isoform X3 [Belonocnema kinseyi]